MYGERLKLALHLPIPPHRLILFHIGVGMMGFVLASVPSFAGLFLKAADPGSYGPVLAPLVLLLLLMDFACYCRSTGSATGGLSIMKRFARFCFALMSVMLSTLYLPMLYELLFYESG